VGGEDGERAELIVYGGGGQAVHLPAWCRFEGTHVRLRREGERVVLEPLHEPLPDWPEGYRELLESLGPVSDSFMRSYQARMAGR
jgi:virulence-associated protein VagC